MTWRQHFFVRAFVIFVDTVQRYRRTRLLRSFLQPVNRLLRRRVTTALPATSPLPKRLWLYWHQGEAEAPRLVAQCLQTWRDHNPGWDVQVLDAATLPAEVTLDDLPEDISLQALSDVLRLRLLRRYGGVWVDATAYCVRPLDDWLPPLLSSGFFAFTLPAHDRLIGSWFLAASPGAPLIETWESAATLYWRVRRRADAYYWVHYLFEFVTITSPLCGAVWDATPTVDSRDCWHVYHSLIAEQDVEKYEALAHQAQANGVPFHRLSHKHGLADRDAHQLMARYLDP